jgi:hypothetical protein
MSEMTRPHGLSLSDQQMRWVQRYAQNLPVELRDKYLRVIADRLTGEPSDSAVMAAINIAIENVNTFMEYDNGPKETRPAGP